MPVGFNANLGPGVILSTPVAAAVAVIGDRWAFMIIRDVYLGIGRFEALRCSTEAARGTLTSRLKALVANGILSRQAYQSSPIRHEYRLTEKGLDLYPIVLMLWAWDLRWGGGGNLPSQLIHETCGHSLVPIYRCGTCKQPLNSSNVNWTVSSNFQRLADVPPRYQRRTKSLSEINSDSAGECLTALDCIGDRWTSLVLAAAFFGLRRFDDITDAIGIATNILADRLRLLVQAKVLEKVLYQQQPQRYEYRLTEKGRHFYPYVVALHVWANRWLIAPGEAALRIQHAFCQADLQGEVVCSHCHGILAPQEVTFKFI